MTDVNPMKAWRDRMGWTVTTAAQQLGIDLRTLQKYEKPGATASLTVRLAAAALERGIEPLDEPDPLPF